MAFTKISQLLFTLNIFKGSSWHNLFSGLMLAIGRLLYRILICALGKVADIIQSIFKKLAGIDSSGVEFQAAGGSTTVGGDPKVSGDIVQYIVQSHAMRNILWAFIILAIVMLLIATFIGTIKAEFAKDGNNNKRKVIKYAFRGFANLVLVPMICLFGLAMGNFLLRAIDGATSAANSTTLSAQIFMAGGYNANRVRQSEEYDSSGQFIGYQDNSFGKAFVSSGLNFGVFVDDTAGQNRKRAADKIDDCFTSIKTLTLQSEATINLSQLGLWHDGAFARNWTFKIAGENLRARPNDRNFKEDGTLTVKAGESVTFSIYDVGLVCSFYDLTPGSFDYLISFVCLVFCCYTFLIVALGLVKRLFYLSILFVISPGVCALYPIDEGKALERWRAEFIKYTLSAYSAVIVLNLFLALLPTLLTMNLFTESLWPTLPVPKEFANYIARLLIVIGGLTFFKDATKQLAAVIGAADANDEGNAAKGNFAKGVARTFRGVGIASALAGKAVKTAGKVVNNTLNAGYQGVHNALHKNKDADTLGKNDAENKQKEGGLEGQAKPTGGTNNAEANSMNKPSTGGSVGSGAPVDNKADDKSNAKKDRPTYTGNLLKDARHGLLAGGAALGKKLGNTKVGKFATNVANKAKGAKDKVADVYSHIGKTLPGKIFKGTIGAVGGVAKSLLKPVGKEVKALIKNPIKHLKIRGTEAVNVARGVGDMISGVVTNSIRMKDVKKWTSSFKGGSRYQREEAKKDFEKHMGEKEKVEATKMRSDIHDIASKINKMTNEQERMAAKINEIDNKTTNNNNKSGKK